MCCLLIQREKKKTHPDNPDEQRTVDERAAIGRRERQARSLGAHCLNDHYHYRREKLDR